MEARPPRRPEPAHTTCVGTPRSPQSRPGRGRPPNRLDTHTPGTRSGVSRFVVGVHAPSVPPACMPKVRALRACRFSPLSSSDPRGVSRGRWRHRAGALCEVQVLLRHLRGGEAVRDRQPLRGERDAAALARPHDIPGHGDKQAERPTVCAQTSGHRDGCIACRICRIRHRSVEVGATSVDIVKHGCNLGRIWRDFVHDPSKHPNFGRTRPILVESALNSVDPGPDWVKLGHDSVDLSPQVYVRTNRFPNRADFGQRRPNLPDIGHTSADPDQV